METDIKLIEKIEDMAKPFIINVDGKLFTSKKLTEVNPEKQQPEIKVFDPPELKFWTLTSFVDFIAANLEGIIIDNMFIHVVDYKTVMLIEKFDSSKEKRKCHIGAYLDEVEGFPFNRWIDKEDFVIKSLSFFEQNPGLESIHRYTGKMSDERIHTNQDDGITQQVHLTNGVVIEKGLAAIKNPFMLRPYRTFLEIQQPESAYNFRIQADGKDETKKIKCALFEAEGGKWRLQAVQAIKAWLLEQIKGIPIFA